MLDGLLRTPEVVQDHGVGLDVTAAPIQEDDLRAPPPLGFHVAMVAARGHHDQSVDRAMQQVHHQFPLPGCVFAGAADDDHRVVAGGHCLHGLCHARVERVHQVGDDEPDASDPVAGAKAVSNHVAAESEGDDRLLDALLHFRPDARLHVHDSRDGLQAGAGSESDVAHRGLTGTPAREARSPASHRVSPGPREFGAKQGRGSRARCGGRVGGLDLFIAHRGGSPVWRSVRARRPARKERGDALTSLP